MLFIKKMFQRIFRRNLTTFFGLNTIKSKNLLKGNVSSSVIKTPLITTSILGPIYIKINEKLHNKYKSHITLIYNREYSFNADIIEKNGILGFIHRGLFNPFYYERILVVPSMNCDCEKKSDLLPSCNMMVESFFKDNILEQHITQLPCKTKKN